MILFLFGFVICLIDIKCLRKVSLNVEERDNFKQNEQKVKY